MTRSGAVRALWIGGASVLTVATLAFGTLQAVAGVAHEEHDARTVITQPVRTLDVVADGSVTVIGDDVSRVTIDEHVSVGLRKPHRSIWRNGDELFVRGTCDHFLATFCGVDVVIRVPHSVVALVRGDDVTVEGLQAGADLASEGGGISVRRVAGPLRLRSQGGDVDATRLRGGTVDVRSDGGGISLSFAAPPRHVAARSSGGGILVVLPDRPVAYRVDATAAGGSTDAPVRTDPTSSRVIRAESSGGDVTVRYVAG